MKKCIFVLILILAVQFLVPAQPLVVVAGNWHVLYEVGDPPPQPLEANDFHICGIIESQNNYMPKLDRHAEFVVGGGVPWYLAEYTIEKVPNHPTHWYFTAHFQTDGFIMPGTVMHFGLYFITNYCNVAVINCAYWTYFKKAVGRMPMLSFDIDRSMVNFMNTGDSPLVLQDIEVGVIQEAVPLDDMVTEGLGDPGTDVGASTYQVDWVKIPQEYAEILERGLEPGAQIKFHLEELINRPLESGEFLQIRGNTLYRDQLLPWWLQHEEP
jgi:hypothetical protein